MKKLLLSVALTLGFLSFSHAQCSVQVNDSLLNTYDYVLNAINATGTAPFVYSWTVTDGNGIPVPFTTHPGGDSITIDAATLQNNYGCVIYQLCMTDATNCTTCSSDTAALQVPFPCYSQFNSSIVGPNQVSLTLASSIPPFLITNQFVTWTDGNGQGQGMPYMGPGTILTYTPGASNPSNKFFCCIMTTTINGGCISCDSIQYTNSALGINELDKMKLHIAPNPASTSVKIENSSPIEAINLYNSVGQKLEVNYTLKGNEAQLNIAEFPKGVYTVEITSTSGIFKEQLIKE
nr:T9SS type A sorting domain-containing protein [uncultured Fluviicola sp.]